MNKLISIIALMDSLHAVIPNECGQKGCN